LLHERGPEAEARFVTEDGGKLDLRMTRKAIAQCVTCFSAASLRARAQPPSPDEVVGIPAASEGAAPLGGEVLMGLDVNGFGATLFVLSREEAVVLAAQLLDAANAREKLPQ
jgi:hypothetical protein